MSSALLVAIVKHLFNTIVITDLLHIVKDWVGKVSPAERQQLNKEEEERRQRLAEERLQRQQERLREEKKQEMLKMLRDRMHNAKLIDIFSQSTFECSVENDILCFSLPLSHHVRIQIDRNTPLVEARLCVEVMNMLNGFLTKYAAHIQSGRLAFAQDAKLTKPNRMCRLAMAFPYAHNLVFVCDDMQLQQYQADILSIAKDATDIIAKLTERKMLSRKRFCLIRK